MARFNANRKSSSHRNVESRNHHNVDSYMPRDKRAQLYLACVTNMISNKFYESEQDNIARVQQLIKEVAQQDPEFVAKLAVYVRENMKLRTMPLILMVELAKHARGNNVVSRGTERVIQRADELSEILAYYMHANGHDNLKKLSKQIQSGVAAAFEKFDEYQLSKYRKTSSEVTLRDAMFITHPKPKSQAREVLYKLIANNELRSKDTWEAAKSKTGQDTKNAAESEKKKASRETWEQMIDSRKMGYMATLRNLVNFVEDDISGVHIKKVCDYLTNVKAIENSKQLPFRFYTAYRELEDLARYRPGAPQMSKLRLLAAAVVDAGYKAMINVSALNPNESVLSVADVSGSMCAPVGNNSSVKCSEIALFYSRMFGKLNPGCSTGYFGTEFAFENNLRKADPYDTTVINRVGHGTQAFKIFERLNREKISFDKIVIFSDMQFWGRSSWSIAVNNSFEDELAKYRKNVNPNAVVILFDLIGYGDSPVKWEGRNFYMAGYSDDALTSVGNMLNTSRIISEINDITI